MTKTTIEKLLELLNNKNLQEVKNILTTELLKENGNKKQAKIFDLVKKYINRKSLDYKPALKMIQIQENGTQSICDGYTLIKFNNYLTELDALPNTRDNNKQPLNTESILGNIKSYDFKTITQDYLFVLNNLKKYISYVKTREDFDKDETISIPFANKIFDANLLQIICDFYGNDFENVKYTLTEENFKPTHFYNENITALILPMRNLEQEKMEKTIKQFNEFKEKLQNANN